jgi:PAS domain S-box-containing protein
MVPDAPAAQSGWPALFWEAFTRSKNAMVLLDDQRRHVEVNGAYLQLLGRRRSDVIGRPVFEFVAHGPIVSTREWRALLRRKQFTGVADLVTLDGSHVTVEFAGHPEVVTGKQLVLFVAMRTTHGGRRPRGDGRSSPASAPLSDRELEVVRLIASGFSGPEIAEELRLAHNTVRTHVRNAMTKLDARSRAHLVAKTLAEGLYWPNGQ